MSGIAIVGLLGLSLSVGGPSASLRDSVLATAYPVTAFSDESPRLLLPEALLANAPPDQGPTAHPESRRIGWITAGVPVGGLVVSLWMVTIRSISSPTADTRPAPLGASIAGAATDTAGRYYLGKLAHNSNMGLKVSIVFGSCRHI
jgi:hypothetical protein